ncbi:MAG: hypothetical protein FWD18_09250 [Micrococcales bacterium]|nr:hypothetical protein [Micrococcales bacterium]
MRTLTVTATAPGAGATTLAALAYDLARRLPQGPPRLHAPHDDDLHHRLCAPPAQVVDPGTVVWDAGTLPPGALAATLQASSLLALVTPDTPLGHADALEHVDAVDARARQRLVVVTVDLYRTRRRSRPDLPTTHLHIPHDKAFTRPGPLPHDLDTYAHHTRTAIQRWAAVVTTALYA